MVIGQLKVVSIRIVIHGDDLEQDGKNVDVRLGACMVVGGNVDYAILVKKSKVERNQSYVVLFNIKYVV